MTKTKLRASTPGFILGMVLIGINYPSTTSADPFTDIDNATIAQNRETGKDWPAHGFDDAGTRFSPLYQVNDTSVQGLGLEWSYSLESTRGVQATPIVVDGVMYVTAPWSIVHAIDVRSGEKLWVYDPEVPREYGAM